MESTSIEPRKTTFSERDTAMKTDVATKNSESASCVERLVLGREETEPVENQPTIGRGCRNTIQAIMYRVYNKLRDVGNTRHLENVIGLRFLGASESILDIGCGRGGFVQLSPESITGIDIDSFRVQLCQRTGLSVREGNALNLDFPDNYFDGIHAAHIMHVFAGIDAITVRDEMLRVLRPGGLIVINGRPWTRRWADHAEDIRPWPAPAMRDLFRGYAVQERIWFRRPPLIKFCGHRSPNWQSVGRVVNSLQYAALFRKYWSHDGYVVAFRSIAESNCGRRLIENASIQHIEEAACYEHLGEEQK